MRLRQQCGPTQTASSDADSTPISSQRLIPAEAHPNRHHVLAYVAHRGCWAGSSSCWSRSGARRRQVAGGAAGAHGARGGAARVLPAAAAAAEPGSH